MRPNFRAWHKTWSPQKSDEYKGINGMQYVHAWSYSNRGNLSVKLSDWSDWVLVKDDIVLMQYSGLKDKHGRDIYEGDIVSNGAYEFTVAFYKGCFVLMKETEQKEIGICLWQNPDLEIIGNLYENSTLLTPEKPNESEAPV
jgi:uncharacterized phage protein (TIGR01671 family)